jgi:hypothetical protein
MLDQQQGPFQNLCAQVLPVKLAVRVSLLPEVRPLAVPDVRAVLQDQR